MINHQKQVSEKKMKSRLVLWLAVNGKQRLSSPNTFNEIENSTTIDNNYMMRKILKRLMQLGAEHVWECLLVPLVGILQAAKSEQKLF